MMRSITPVSGLFSSDAGRSIVRREFAGGGGATGGLSAGANGRYAIRMMPTRRKNVNHYHVPGDSHERMFSCSPRLPLLTNDD
jgi:hypothetical protein